MAQELSSVEQSRRNYLKEEKPHVYEKVMKFSEKIANLPAGFSQPILALNHIKC